MYEVSVFNETLLNQQRELLENGNILFISADGKQEEAGTRLIAQKIELLDDVLTSQQSRGGASFHIVVDHQDALTIIRQLLGEPEVKGALITLTVKLEQGHAQINLPGKYTLSPAALDRIRIIQGVVSAEEIAA